MTFATLAMSPPLLTISRQSDLRELLTRWSAGFAHLLAARIDPPVDGIAAASCRDDLSELNHHGVHGRPTACHATPDIAANRIDTT
jgi:hypothetical protein